MAATLYERLGGRDGIERLVTDIVENHYNNPLDSHPFRIN